MHTLSQAPQPPPCDYLPRLESMHRTPKGRILILRNISCVNSSPRGYRSGDHGIKILLHPAAAPDLTSPPFFPHPTLPPVDHARGRSRNMTTRTFASEKRTLIHSTDAKGIVFGTDTPLLSICRRRGAGRECSDGGGGVRLAHLHPHYILVLFPGNVI